MNILFTEKELAVVELMAPGSTAEDIINSVLRAWFNANVDRIYKNIKPHTEVIDEIIVKAANDKVLETAEKLSKDVV